MAQAQVKAIPATSAVRFNRFLALVYLVMALGMAITALVSSAVSTNPEFMKRILFYPWFTFGLFLLQIVVVVFLSAAVQRMSTGAALLLFLLYSALTGLALSSIFIYYSQTTICIYFLGDCRDVFIRQHRWAIHKGRHERRRQVLNARLAGLAVWMDFRPVLPALGWAEPGDEFYRYHALCRVDSLGHQSAKAALFTNGRQTGYGRDGGRRCIGALPRLHQPVPAAAPYIQALVNKAEKVTLNREKSAK